MRLSALVGVTIETEGKAGEDLGATRQQVLALVYQGACDYLRACWRFERDDWAHFTPTERRLAAMAARDVRREVLDDVRLAVLGVEPPAPQGLLDDLVERFSQEGGR